MRVSRLEGRPLLRIQPAVAGGVPVMSGEVTMCRLISALETRVGTTANTKRCVSGYRYCGIVPDTCVALQQRRQWAVRRWQASSLYSGRGACSLRTSNMQTHNVALLNSTLYGPCVVINLRDKNQRDVLYFYIYSNKYPSPCSE